ncbi:MAG: hypothetical protein IJR99_05575 [Kiritimatiellae bacterium]|nr:hypothetical protein [Kiritimatiellia bacterium]
MGGGGRTGGGAYPDLCCYEWQFYQISESGGSPSLAVAALGVRGGDRDEAAWIAEARYQRVTLDAGRNVSVSARPFDELAGVVLSPGFRELAVVEPVETYAGPRTNIVRRSGNPPAFAPAATLSAGEKEGFVGWYRSTRAGAASAPVFAVFADADDDGRADAFAASGADALTNGLYRWTLFLNGTDGWKSAGASVRVGREFVDPSVDAATNGFYRVQYYRDPRGGSQPPHVSVFRADPSAPFGISVPFAESHAPAGARRFVNGFPAATFDRFYVPGHGPYCRTFIQYFELTADLRKIERIPCERFD